MSSTDLARPTRSQGTARACEQHGGATQCEIVCQREYEVVRRMRMLLHLASSTVFNLNRDEGRSERPRADGVREKERGDGIPGRMQ